MKCAHHAARRFGLKDRGLLREGFADVSFQWGGHRSLRAILLATGQTFAETDTHRRRGEAA